MMKRTQLLLPTTLLSLLAGVYVTACSEDSSPGPGSSTGATASSGSGGSGATGAGATGAGATDGGTTGGSSSDGGNGNTGGNSTNSGGNAGNSGGGGGTPNAGGTGGGDMVGGNTGSGGTSSIDPDVLTVQLGEVRQIIRGFGINATIMDLQNAKPLPWNQLFTLEGEDALGLSILRIGMNEDGNHRDVPSDWTTARDLGARVIGSCWSAPGDWKEGSDSVDGGGHLIDDYYEEWATLIAEYARDHQLYAMSIANEADFASCMVSPCDPPRTDAYPSMVYTGQEMAEFVKVAGPIFDEIAPDTKMIAPEASLWQHVWSSISPDGRELEGGGYLSSDPLECGCYANEIDPAVAETCADHCKNGEDGSLAPGGYDYGHWLASDSDAWSAFDIMGVHQYETQVGYAWPDDVNGGVRDREVWQTEMSGVMYWPEQGPSIDIENGVAVARWIHSALTVGEASAWLYWWYEAYYQDDNEGLAYIRSDTESNLDPNTIAKRYYTMGNFSRYIRPDVFHAVQMAGPSPDDVMVSAYKGDNGEVVVVAINETNQPVEIPIAITGGAAPAAMVPHLTSANENWAEGAAVPVMDGSFQADLPAMSVTTFVSE